MRKINLTQYFIEVEDKKLPFDVKGSIYAALYHPDLKLAAMALLSNDRLAQKIKSAGDSILLEEAEYQKIRSAFETLRGWEVHDVELVKRVFDAEEVEVKEA